MYICTCICIYAYIYIYMTRQDNLASQGALADISALTLKPAFDSACERRLATSSHLRRNRQNCRHCNRSTALL